MALTLEQIEDLDDTLTDHAAQLHRAEVAVRSAAGTHYRVPEARDAAVREAEAHRLEIATAARDAAQALETAVRETQTAIHDVDSVAAFMDDAKPAVRTFWKSEAETAPIPDLVSDVQAALRKGDLPTLAVIVRHVGRRLADQPAATFDANGYNRQKTLPDQADRVRLRKLLEKATAKLALTPDPEVIGRLGELREAADTVRKATDPYKPKRVYRFQQPGDRITQPA